MSSSGANASGKRWHHSQTAGTTTPISQGSVATVLKWDGQKYSHLRQVSSWCCGQKLLELANAAQSYWKHKSGTFLWTMMYVATMFTSFAAYMPLE